MRYILAVSGGVDSVVMLDMMARSSEHELIVAHVDHGIRPDSRADAAFVADLCQTYGLPYQSVRFELGKAVSEAEARQARHGWLETIRRDHQADAIVTAHHSDDVIETMMINLIRGTGWRGLCPLQDTSERYRPLIAMSKAQIVRYAIEHNLSWREDSTNDDMRYLRNRLRHTLLRSLSPAQRRRWLDLYEAQSRLAMQIDSEIATLMPYFVRPPGLSRYRLIGAGPTVTAEIIMTWQQHRFTRKAMQRLWHFAATARPGKQLSEDGICFRVSTRDLIV